MILRNVSGWLRCDGFERKNGRNPCSNDYRIVPGPLDIRISEHGINGLDTSHAIVDDVEVDASGLLATSGWVDAHTHALHAGSRAGEYFERWRGLSYRSIADRGGGIAATVAAVTHASEDQLAERLCQYLKEAACRGSAIVEIKTGYAFDLSGEERLLRILQRVRQAGFPIHRTFMPLHAVPVGWREETWTDAVIEWLPKVTDAGLAESVDAFIEKGFFGFDSASRFFKKAASLGLHVRAHCDELSDSGHTGALMDMGARSVDHLQYVGDDALSRWPSSSCVATLLPATSFYLGLPFADARRLIGRGAPVALATDYNPGTAPDPHLGFTMLLAARHLSMTPAEIWCAVTLNGARSLGLKTVHGWPCGPSGTPTACLWPDGRYRDADAFVEDVIINRTSPVMVIIEGRLYAGSRQMAA